MLKIPGYTTELLQSVNENGQVYRAVRDEDQLPVIVLVCPPGDTAREARVQQLYGLVSKLRFEGIVQAIALLRSGRNLVMVFERFLGESLKNYLTTHTFDLATFGTISQRLAGILSKIHTNRIIHGAISPSTILIAPDSLEVKITGFEQACPANRERKLESQPDLVEEDLPYISPEQTGRMGRDLDFRGDLYSLGIVFYECLVGHPPFQAEPMELIHLHLAGTVQPPHLINPHIPLQLSSMVLKLLEKDPVRRYQTARGLQADLFHFFEDKVDSFELGLDEVPETLLLPTQMYGRQRELDTMRRIFSKVAEGSTELVSLAGQPGVGKTALVQAFRKRVRHDPAFFTKGKFDRFQRGVPFSGIIQAFSSWAGHILTGSDQDLEFWKARISDALGHIGHVMVEIVPNLKWIIGPQPPVPRLGPSEAQNRVKLALLRFISAVATKETPLVLFLDDFQWADSASLQFVEALVLLRKRAALMIIASYRQQEVDHHHPFFHLLERLERNGMPAESLQIAPWNEEDANQFIADTLGRTIDETKPLAELVKRKTANNPLFVRQFLLHAYNLGLIYFTQGDGWHWNSGAIERAGIPDDIVGMMTEKIQRLPEQARSVLQVAGCIGNGFETELLLAVGELNEDEVALGLYYLTVEGLIAPAGSRYHFTHDRIFEAAIALFPESEREQLHLKIGRYLVKLSPGDKASDQVFEITKHLNRCIYLLDDRQERLDLAQLNLVAGKKSLEAASYVSAERHLRSGLTLMGDAEWSDEYRLLFELHLGVAECLFLSGDHDQARERFEALLTRQLSMLDRSRVVAMMVALYNINGELQRSIRTGLEGLAHLDIKIQEKPSMAALLLILGKVRIAFQGRGDNALLNRPVSNDERFLARMRILVELVVPAYFSNSRLSLYLSLYNMWLLLRYGLHSNAPLVFAMFSLVLGSAWGSYRDRYRLGRLASILDERIGDRRFSPRVDFIRHCHINPWIKPLRGCIEPLRDCLQNALEVGDLQYATFASVEQLNFMFLTGEPLDTVIEEADRSTSFIQQLGYNEVRLAALRIAWVAAFLKGDMDRLPHATGSDPFQLEPLKKLRIRISYFFTAPYAASALYYMGRYEEAYDLSRKVGRRIHRYIPFARQIVENTFYLGMTGAALYPSASPQRCKLIRKQIRVCLKRFQNWARQGPSNHRAQYLLLKAEMSRLKKNHNEAWHFYTAARAHASSEGLDHLVALIHERMGTFAIDRDWENEAAYHLTASLNGYRKWKADAKARQIRDLYGNHIQTPGENVVADEDFDDHKRTVSKGAIDLSTVVESSLAISQEVELELVLERVMTSAIENAGAQRGLLLLKSEDGLWLEAEGSVNGGFLRIPRMDPIDTSAQLPMNIVRYVQRTSETVVLGQACEQGLFNDDPYISETRVLSVLVMPILTQNKFVGILYLENNLVSNAFTRDRTEVLRVIAAQAAIALENARLYDELSVLNRELEQRVEDRTAALRDANAKLKTEVEERIKAEKELRELQSKLVETARRAGMTEVAIGVLHNVGNVLNSVTISATCLAESFKNSKLPQLDRLVDLLAEHKDDLGTYLSEDQRGKLFPAFLEKLAEVLRKQRANDIEENKKLTQHLSHAIEVIRAQQAQANVKAVLEPISPSELVEESVKVNNPAINTSNIRIIRNYEEVPELLVDKHRVLQILINLVKNAVQSMEAKGDGNHLLTLDCYRNNEGSTVFVVSDTGVGIARDHLNRVFSYGFTTKRDGHGFGLHNAANSASEMGGSLKVYSEGTNCGATFTLTLPLQEHQKV